MAAIGIAVMDLCALNLVTGPLTDQAATAVADPVAATVLDLYVGRSDLATVETVMDLSILDLVADLWAAAAKVAAGVAAANPGMLHH